MSQQHQLQLLENIIVIGGTQLPRHITADSPSLHRVKNNHRWVLEDSGEEVCSVCATVNDAPTIHHEYTQLEVIGTGINTARQPTLLKGQRNWNLPGQSREKAAQSAAVDRRVFISGLCAATNTSSLEESTFNICNQACIRAVENGKRVGGRTMHSYAAASLIVALRRNGHFPEFVQEIAQESGGSVNAILGLVHEVANSDIPLEAAKPQVYIPRLRCAFQHLTKHTTSQQTAPIVKLVDNLKPIFITAEPEATATRHLPTLCTFIQACWPTPWSAPEAHSVACALLAYSIEMSLSKPITLLKEFFKHMTPHVYQTPGAVMERYKALLEMFCSLADKVTWVRARLGSTYESKRRWLALGGLQEILKANGVSTEEIKRRLQKAGGVVAAVTGYSSSVENGVRVNGHEHGQQQREENSPGHKPPRKKQKLNTIEYVAEFIRNPEGCSIPYEALKRPSWATTTYGMSLIAYMHHEPAVTGTKHGRNPSRLQLYIAANGTEDLPEDGNELDAILFSPGEWEGILRPPEEVSALARIMVDEWPDEDENTEVCRIKSVKDKEASRARTKKRKKAQEARGTGHLTNSSRTKTSKINYAVLASLGLDADCVLNDEHGNEDREVEVLEEGEGEQEEFNLDQAQFLFVTEEDDGYAEPNMRFDCLVDDDRFYHDALIDEGEYEEEV